MQAHDLFFLCICYKHIQKSILSDINLLLCSSHIQTSTKTVFCDFVVVVIIVVVDIEGIWRVFGFCLTVLLFLLFQL